MKQTHHSWRAQSLASTKTQRKGAFTPQETESDLPPSVRQSPVEAWVSWGSHRDEALTEAVLEVLLGVRLLTGQH